MKIKIIQFLIIAFTFVGCREDARFSKEHIKEREKIDAELAAEKKADAERFFGISCDMYTKGGITITFDKKRNNYIYSRNSDGYTSSVASYTTENERYILYQSNFSYDNNRNRIMFVINRYSLKGVWNTSDYRYREAGYNKGQCQKIKFEELDYSRLNFITVVVTPEI